VQKRVAVGTSAFTFQMQSLFDASTPWIPHFVYTDHTHLENRHCTTGTPNLYSPNWIALERQVCQNKEKANSDYTQPAILFVRSDWKQKGEPGPSMRGDVLNIPEEMRP
jgi:hypothetical protein